MKLTIELSGNLEAVLKARARAKGVSETGFVRQILEQVLSPEEQQPGQPFETGYGMWARYGPGLSAEEIDENRRDMFRNFAQDF